MRCAVHTADVDLELLDFRMALGDHHLHIIRSVPSGMFSTNLICLFKRGDGLCVLVVPLRLE
jgi:hypothetical protein